MYSMYSTRVSTYIAVNSIRSCMYTCYHDSLYDLQKQDEQDNHNHCDSQPVNDEQQKNEDEIQKNSEQQHSDKPQEDGEQQSSSEQQGSMEDNNQQETDNLVANNDAEKQEESQQSNIDLSQQNQQIDGDNCIEIKAMKVVSDNAHKENGATREESYHKMVPLCSQSKIIYCSYL